MEKPEKPEAKTSAEDGAVPRALRAKIRCATRSDAVALRSIYAHYVENTTVSFELETPSVAEMERRIAEVDGVYPFLVCVVEGENGEDGEILSVDACDATDKIDKNGKPDKTGKTAWSVKTRKTVNAAAVGQAVDVGGERIVGYALAHRAFERAAYAWTAETSVYVDRAWRRRGLGEALYSALIEILEAQGVRTLYAVVVAENEASVGFHRRVGYREFATFKNAGWKFGRWLDVVWLERTLGVWRDAEEKNGSRQDARTGKGAATIEKTIEKTTKERTIEERTTNFAPTPIRPLSEFPEARIAKICAVATRRFEKTVE